MWPLGVTNNVPANKICLCERVTWATCLLSLTADSYWQTRWLPALPLSFSQKFVTYFYFIYLFLIVKKIPSFVPAWKYSNPVVSWECCGDVDDDNAIKAFWAIVTSALIPSWQWFDQDGISLWLFNSDHNLLRYYISRKEQLMEFFLSQAEA